MFLITFSSFLAKCARFRLHSCDLAVELSQIVSAQQRKGPIYAGLKYLFERQKPELLKLGEIKVGLGRMVRCLEQWQIVSHKIQQDYNDTLAWT